MAIYYKNLPNDRSAIYSAAEKWKEECLIKDQSLLWNSGSIWSKENLERFRVVFVENPDQTGSDFDQKLKKQLQNESEGVYKLAIEMVYVYYLFTSFVKYETKVKKLKMIADWKGIEFNKNWNILEALRDGIGNPGTAYNTAKYEEFTFLYMFVTSLKESSAEERLNILQSTSRLKNMIIQNTKLVKRKVQLQHILLHLLLPESFDRIASWGNKEKITKTFSHYLTNPSVQDTDEKLLIIREALEKEYPNQKLDFYDIPEIMAEWEGKYDSLPLTTPTTSHRNQVPDTLIDFTNKIETNHLIFENIEVIVERIQTALKTGKHIILTGPPGTGKSKIAKVIATAYGVDPIMVTASSNWSTYETIGGYRPDQEGNLYFNEGLFLRCIKDKNNKSQNRWIIIDEINRADIDKAFGSLFSVLTGDEVVLPFEAKSGKAIMMKPEIEGQTDEPNDHTYVIPRDWRIIATMNTIDKASLYEMSYAFMRRFAFIPIGVPKEITEELIEQYVQVWEMAAYPHIKSLQIIWTVMNEYRQVGPAIIEDVARYTENNDDFTSALILYILPQFEGVPIQRVKEFVKRVIEETEDIIEVDQLNDFVNDFLDSGMF